MIACLTFTILIEDFCFHSITDCFLQIYIIRSYL